MTQLLADKVVMHLSFISYFFVNVTELEDWFSRSLKGHICTLLWIKNSVTSDFMEVKAHL